MTNLEETKDKFYEDLNTVITTNPHVDKLIILRDFNARVGCDNISWEGVIGKHGVENCSRNGFLLLQTYAKYNLPITNTPSSTYQPETGRHECIPAQRIDILSTKSSQGIGTDKLYESRRPCVAQSVGQTIVWLSAKSISASNIRDGLRV